MSASSAISMPTPQISGMDQNLFSANAYSHPTSMPTIVDPGTNVGCEKPGVTPNSTGSQETKQNTAHLPTGAEEKLPFEDFQHVLSFVASIGLASSISCAFSLVQSQSLFGDDSDIALISLKRAGIYLAWSASCFIVALVFIVAPQLLYTEIVIAHIIKQKSIDSWNRRLIRVSIGIFAWIPLMFQVAAMFLLSESLQILSTKATLLARYGITAGVFMVGVVTFVGVLSEVEGRAKFVAGITFGFFPSKIQKNK